MPSSRISNGVPADRRLERRVALLAQLEDRELDGLIVTHLPNIRYLTGFTGSSGIVLVLERETVFFSDFRYSIQADEEVADVARVEIVPSDIWKRVWEVLAEYRDVETMGFESASVAQADAARIAAVETRVRREPVRDVVESLRERKAPEEVAAIRSAACLASEALKATLPHVGVGTNERDIAARLEFELRSRGSEWHPFPTIVASGPRSALPHAGTSDRVLERGDWLLIDFGAQLHGYCADVTRTCVVGRNADDRQRTVYDLVRDAQGTALGAVRSGMSGKDADHVARSVIEQRGFGDMFGHSLGHGLGLEVHEAPRLSKTNESPLPEGAVVTIEPGVYVPGWGGVRIEDDVCLGPDGAELLSDGNTELMELV